MRHEVHPYRKAAERVLALQGGFYSFDDILDLVATGHFQSFPHGESWAVTRVAVFPQKSAVEVVFMIGSMDELRELENQIIDFAAKIGIDTGIASGRLGFLNKAFYGWKAVSANFVKDFSHG